jgi:hypothetical protein
MPSLQSPQSFADFWIRVPTRHPAAHAAYDPERHRYRPDYVRPPGWTMELTASVPELDEPAPRPLGKELEGIDDERPVLPDTIESYTWTVTEMTDPSRAFSTTVTKDRGAPQPWRVSVMVPRTGSYDVHLSVRTTTGAVENSKDFRIRDILMVSIGESFASGQGNPDLPAVLSRSQTLSCKQTTLAMLRDKLTEVYEDYQDKLADKGGLLGKFAARRLQGLQDDVEMVEHIAGVVVDFFANMGRAIFGGSSRPSPRPARWQEPAAYRSYQSGPARAAYLLESESDHHADRVTFLSFARSGAEIQAGLLGPRTTSDGEPIDGWIGNIGEIEELVNTVGDRPIDVLHISIGGNDVRFSGTLTDVVAGDIPQFAAFTPWALVFQAGNDVDARRKAVAEAERRLGVLRRVGFPALVEAVAELRPGQVSINEYPIGLFERMRADGSPFDERGCGVFSGPDVDLSLDDWLAIKQLGVKLNALIHDVAADPDNRWILIDAIAEQFAGHGYCATADPSRPGPATNRRGSYFNSAEQSCRNQGDFEGTMHPNEHGHEVFAERIAAVIGAETGPRDRWLTPALQVMSSPRTIPI